MQLPVSDEASRARIISGDIVGGNEQVKAADDTSIRDFIVGHASGREALELLGNLFYLKHVWGASCVALLREVFSDRTQGLAQISAGMDALTSGLADLLRRRYASRVRFDLGSPITAIRVGKRRGSGVEITFREGGGFRTERFECALCTIPFPALRPLALEGLSIGKMAAIDRYHFAPSTKVALNYSTRFWETGSKPIFGGCSVTDQIAGQIYCPTCNDHGITHPEPDPDYPSWLPIPPAPDANLPVNPALEDPGPGVLLGCYSWGTDASRLAALPPDERIASVLRCVREIHGPDADAYLDGGASMAWSEYPWTAGALLQPGTRELQLYRDAAMQPEGALFFCGDHLSPDPGWVQGSIRSTREQLCRMLEGVAGR